jgi:hypothetical protein
MPNDDPPRISLARCAEAVAHLHAFDAAEHAAVTARLGWTSEEVAEAVAGWSRAMGDGLARHDASLVVAFARAYSRAERLLQMWRPKAADVKPDPLLEADVAQAAKDAAAREAQPARRPTAMGLQAVAPPAPTEADAPRPRTRSRRPPSRAPSTPPTVPELPPQSVTAPPPKSVTAPPATVVAAGTPAVGLAVPKSPTIIDAPRTVPLEDRPGAMRVLPFQDAADAAVTVRPPGPRSRARRAESSPPATLPAGSPTTLPVPGAEHAQPLQGTRARATDPVAVNPATFPIPRYAELTVALATGDDRAAVLRRFALSETAWRSIATALGGRISASPALRAEFDAAVRVARGRG